MKKNSIILLFSFFASMFWNITLSADTAVEQRGKIIFLNGTSSAGKSTLAHHLQEILDEPFLCYGFDIFFCMFGNKYLPWGAQKEKGIYYVYQQDVSGEQLTQLQLSKTFYRIYHEVSPAIVKAIVANGGSVVVDEIMIYDETFAYWQEALKDEQVIYVGVKAPLEVLEEREIKRGDRPKGISRFYAERTHYRATYDLVVDSQSETTEQIAIKIIDTFNKKYHRT